MIIDDIQNKAFAIDKHKVSKDKVSYRGRVTLLKWKINKIINLMYRYLILL